MSDDSRAFPEPKTAEELYATRAPGTPLRARVVRWLVRCCRSDRLQGFLFWVGWGTVVCYRGDDTPSPAETDPLQALVYLGGVLLAWWLSRHTYRWLGTLQGWLPLVVIGGAGYAGAFVCMLLPGLLLLAALTRVSGLDGWLGEVVFCALPSVTAGWWLGVRRGQAGVPLAPVFAGLVMLRILREATLSPSLLLSALGSMTFAVLGTRFGHAASKAYPPEEVKTEAVAAAGTEPPADGSTATAPKR